MLSPGNTFHARRVISRKINLPITLLFARQHHPTQLTGAVILCRKNLATFVCPTGLADAMCAHPGSTTGADHQCRWSQALMPPAIAPLMA